MAAHSSLYDQVVALIRANGPIGVAQYMQMALQHPTLGYYMKCDPFGRGGDFVTAPEVSQMFGEMLGVWCVLRWQDMGQPDALMLVELGPGRGTLMADLLRGTKHVPGFHDALQVVLVDTSSGLQAIQRKMLEDAPVSVQWVEHIEQVPVGPSLWIANEFFDALPIYQYVRQADGWHEQMVGVDEAGGLQFVLSPDTSPLQEIAEIGAVVERSPVSEAYMQQIAARLQSDGGAAVVVDYGYEGPAFGDTLQAVQSHAYCDVLSSVGEADITAHVDFTRLAEVAHDAGLSVLPVIEQRDFLRSMGIEARAEMLQAQQDLERLIGGAEMGGLFKVLQLFNISD